MRLNSLSTCVLLLVAGFALPAAGDVFNMPNGLTSLTTVPVGDPGNAADTRYTLRGHGAVAYSYNIGTYEVTAGQYCQFLNAVAATDTYGLYDPDMAIPTITDIWGCNIQRTGESGSYTYTVAADWANRPVNYVSFWDACRFTNWLGNGQPTGSQGPGTTETGAYTLDGYTGTLGGDIVRNPGATWALPTDEEWYKAAFYKGGGKNAGYWDYPTRSDTAPTNILDPAGKNNANFYDLYHTGTGGYCIGDPYYLTLVDAFAGSPGPYGTLDQTGNVSEWSETIHQQYSDSTNRGMFGNGFESGLSGAINSGNGIFTTLEAGDTGFRVVEVPEPTCTTIVLLGSWALFRRRTKK